MRRLIFMLAGGLLTAGTVLTGGIASAGTHAASGVPSADNAGVHHQATATCTPAGNFFFDVTAHGVNYYPGTPNSASSGSTVRLKPSQNRTTSWAFCVNASDQWLITNQGLAMTSRATSPGATVTVETAGSGGNGFTSQLWNLVNVSGSSDTFQNVKTGLFLRVRNNGPIMGQLVTTGSTPTAWTFP